MWDYFEREWEMEDLTKEEMEILQIEWDKLDDFSKKYYETFEDFTEDYVYRMCYSDD